MKKGKGVMILNEYSIYEGYWKDNKPSGRGRILYSDGSYYDGNWVCG